MAGQEISKLLSDSVHRHTYEAHFKSRGRWSRNQKPINRKIRLGCFKLIYHYFILQSSHYNFLSSMDTVKNVFQAR